MSDTLQIISAAMQAEVETLRAIGQNIANAETAAYRRQVPVMRAQFAEELQMALPLADAPQLKIAFDHTAGTLKNTGRPLDLALDGPGFFVVEGADGITLTRRGSLQISPNGLLVDAGGHAVLGQQGPVHLSSGSPVVGTDGSVLLDGAFVDALRIVMPVDADSLQSVGDGRFSTAGELTDVEGRSAVRQGFVEASNVTPVNEIIQLMEAVRRFESEQRFVRAYDEMVGKAIAELGKTG